MRKRIWRWTLLLLLLCSILLPESGWAAGLPERYDSRDYGYVTPVRKQGYGSCWAHTVIACLETYMIKNGMTDPATGKPADETVDLSESHLAWFTYTDAYDRKGMLAGDRTILQNTDDFNWIYLNRGGDAMAAAATMLRGEGPAAETADALRYENADHYQSGLPSRYAYDYNAARLDSAVSVKGGKTDEVKKLLMEYGAAYAIIYQNTKYESENGAYCVPRSALPDDGTLVGNHSVAVVGWDDDYSRMNFREDCRPAQDGAWIAKNSHGTDFGDGGYMYISYEDSVTNNSNMTFFALEDKDRYQNIYQYDGTRNPAVHHFPSGEVTVANVYTADGYERIEAASAAVLNADTAYTMRVYTDVSDPQNPESGQLAYEEGGILPYGGYRTFPIPDGIPVLPGTRFSVVFHFDASGGQGVTVPYDCSGTGKNEEWIHVPHPGTSFFKEKGGHYWYEEREGQGSFRIKAFTNRVTAVQCTTRAVGTVGERTAAKLCSAQGEILSVRLCSGTLPPGMSLRREKDEILLEGVPEKRGEYMGIVSVNTPEEAVFCEFSFIEADGVIEDPPFVLRVRTGNPLKVPIYQGLGENWVQLRELKSALPSGLRLELQKGEIPTLIGTPQQEEYIQTEYEVVLSDGSMRNRKIEWIVYAPEHAFLGNVNPFADLSPADDAYVAVMWAYTHIPQIAAGTSETAFSPEDTVTRAQAVTFLWRAAGCPIAGTNGRRFADVPEDAYYKGAVDWAADGKITRGTGESTFSPEDTLSVRQILTFLYRSRFPGMDGWDGEAIAWAAGEGIKADTARKDAPCPRKNVVQWIYQTKQ